MGRRLNGGESSTPEFIRFFMGFVVFDFKLLFVFFEREEFKQKERTEIISWRIVAVYTSITLREAIKPSSIAADPQVSLSLFP